MRRVRRPRRSGPVHRTWAASAEGAGRRAQDPWPSRRSACPSKLPEAPEVLTWAKVVKAVQAVASTPRDRRTPSGPLVNTHTATRNLGGSVVVPRNRSLLMAGRSPKSGPMRASGGIRDQRPFLSRTRAVPVLLDEDHASGLERARGERCYVGRAPPSRTGQEHGSTVASVAQLSTASTCSSGLD